MSDEREFILQNGATTAGLGTPAETADFDGSEIMEVVNSDTAGTAQMTFQGQVSTSWHPLPYQQDDVTGAQSVGAFTVAANSSHIYHLTSRGYPAIAAAISSPTGFTTGGITVRLLAENE